MTWREGLREAAAFGLVLGFTLAGGGILVLGVWLALAGR